MRTRSSLLVLSLLVGCAGEGETSLRQFSDCGEMDRYMFKMARREMAWDWSGGGRGVNVWGGVETSFSDDGEVPREPGGAGSFSGTNLQEQGVDEADLVKTDGTWLYAVAGGDLVISRAWPIDEARQVARLPLDGYSSQLYLLDDAATIVVISNLWYGERPQPASGETVSWRSASSAVVTVVDVADPTTPVVIRQTYVTGEIATTRRIGDRLYVVTTDDVEPIGAGSTRRQARAALYSAKPADWQVRRFDNRLVSRTTTPEWETDVDASCGCEDTWYSDRYGGTYVTSVLSLDLTDPMSAFEGTAVVGRADRVYATTGAVYVVYSEEDTGPFPSLDSSLDTVVHKLGIRPDRAPTYRASGVVPGVLTDQFAISDRDGVLRIATTRMEDATSGVYTYGEGDATLEELDGIDGLAPGETITSARFVGDLGYIVTWEMQLGDPLFTFDLSDPRAIRLGGELAVTGWSDYLHPLDEGHLLAVGMDGGNDGQRLSVSVFDVSDLQNPRLADRELLPAWGSEAQSEHHAFNWFPETETLTIPSWRTNGQSVLEVLHADPEDVEPIGYVQQPASLVGDDPWCAGIRRSVVMEDWVWAVSSAGMTAARLDDPGGDQVSVRFTGVQPCQDYGF